MIELTDNKLALEQLIQSTPARIGVGCSGTRPKTEIMLKLRMDHAMAVDSVYGDIPKAFFEEFHFPIVQTPCQSKEMYLKRPDLGRKLTSEGESFIREHCKKKPQVQIVISNGLSSKAIESNIRDVYPALLDSLESYGLSSGTTFYVQNGRVACMDVIGEILEPDVLVMLIGERPGLVSADSMSAYMCYKPRIGTIESNRNVISNIHRGGTQPIEAGAQIGAVLRAMLDQKTSGTRLVI
ncbi:MULTISPECIES: ethanolamine ammonia-lyase subunit EutC [Terrilactibacillus]|uniref:Ethanolamine ammonia-lyase small subunit n=2 Tax=Terrilactibacillus TaxID=1795633 RepID=A0A6N8CRE9_9BACI|nr:ethanolamine ammonia-lyase subunit EutC [Terrilactibacillus tamarindi]MTT32819.1 ethanolamine ammonia-lyase subunit EutC [Terrilactibacillus tamarindi]